MLLVRFFLFIYLAMQGLSCITEASTVMSQLSCLKACRILVPRTGIKPVSSALEEVFLTAGPPGKFLLQVILRIRGTPCQAFLFVGKGVQP